MNAMLLAKIFGPVIMLIALFNIFFRDELDRVSKSFHGAWGAYWMSGFLSMLFGLAVINAQGISWDGWFAILPIFGWISFVKGALVLFLGESLSELWGNWPNRIMIGVLRFAFGWGLIWIGYFS